MLLILVLISVGRDRENANNPPVVKKSQQRIIPSAAPENIRSAFRAKFGNSSAETILSELKTNREQISPLEVLTYFGSGFTPGGEVMITLGPLKGADTVVELTSADFNGKINGSIRMPGRDKITLGKNIIIAMDYREMRRAVENVLTRKSDILDSYAAAQLLEVIHSNK